MAWFPSTLQFSAPLFMVSALLVALAFALGHNAFYHSLDGQPVLNNNNSLMSLVSSYDISPQHVNIAVGTLFAFLVKVLLDVAVSTAFDQFAWKFIQGRTATVAVLDGLFSVLGNGFTVLNWTLWRKYPMNMLLATVAWLLPVASMISPSTLSVNVQPFADSSLMPVPRVDFSSLNFPIVGPPILPDVDGGGVVTGLMGSYLGASPGARRIASSTAMQGVILPIEAPSANSSWTLPLYGPALRCENVNGTLYSAITQNVQDAVLDSSVFQYHEHLVMAHKYGYIARTPGPYGNRTLPFTSHGSSLEQRLDTLGLRVEGSPLVIFVAALPHMLDRSTTRECLMQSARDAIILQCTLYNASYVASFTYVNGRQEITASDNQHLNDVSWLATVKNASTKRNRTAMEHFSYQAVMDSFCNVFVGAVEKSSVVSYASRFSTNKTSVLSTPLSNTKQLRFLKDALHSVNVGDGLVNYWRDQSVAQPAMTSTVSLSDALGQVFENTTLSLLSSSLFQPNYTVSAVPDVNVTVTSYRNVYAYSQSVLLTTYGIAIGVSVICVLLGVAAYFVSRGSYSTKFSTIMRTTKNAKLSTGLQEQDLRGTDPLPPHISTAVITFADGPPR